jgi:glycerol-3-phosphate dehydrogenase
LESSYLLSRSKAIDSFPLLRKDNLVGALVYYDGQHNDSRMNVSLAITASLYGATVLNHAEVTELEKDANGKICGAKVRDLLNDDETASQPFSVRAKGVINATGPFTDAVERMNNPQHKEIVAPASGAHVMLPGKLCPKGMGILDAATSDGRVVFVLPWQGMTVAGTTDNACDVEKEPVARADDVDFILKEVSKLLEPDSVLTRDDVLATWSGKLNHAPPPRARVKDECNLLIHTRQASDPWFATPRPATPNLSSARISSPSLLRACSPARAENGPRTVKWLKTPSTKPSRRST